MTVTPSARLRAYVTAGSVGLIGGLAVGDPAPALTVPATSVETVSGTSRVYVVKDGKAEERIVTLGEKIDTRIEVVTGLENGELVVAEPRGRIADGMLVRTSPSTEPGTGPSPSQGR